VETLILVQMVVLVAQGLAVLLAYGKRTHLRLEVMAETALIYQVLEAVVAVVAIEPLIPLVLM